METETKSNNKTLLIAVIILSILVLTLGGYLIYDKVLSKDDKNTSNTTENTNTNANTDTNTNNTNNNKTYKSYNIGDKVTVKLNDSLESTFYVLKESYSNEEYITLFAEKNIGTGAFNTDFTDGNDYKGSLIESKVNELTASWTNVKEKRLITVDEIKATGLTEIKTQDRCIDGGCPRDYVFVKENTFLLYPQEDFDTYHLYEFYWTMTKVNDPEVTQNNATQYVYYVDMSGSIDPQIVGYRPGSDWNKDGRAFEHFGIRPVIVISKDYIK